MYLQIEGSTKFAPTTLGRHVIYERMGYDMLSMWQSTGSVTLSSSHARCGHCEEEEEEEQQIHFHIPASCSYLIYLNKIKDFIHSKIYHKYEAWCPFFLLAFRIPSCINKSDKGFYCYMSIFLILCKGHIA